VAIGGAEARTFTTKNNEFRSYRFLSDVNMQSHTTHQHAPDAIFPFLPGIKLIIAPEEVH
jgi:hypothetical protein